MTEATIGSNKYCFVIAPIGDENSEIRKRSDQILNHVIRPAMKECGIDEVYRADGIPEAGIIPTQVIQRVIDAELVIADLTGRNPNVYYELAVRHAVRKPYVQLIQADEPIPFDITTVRTIPVDHRDLDSVETCRNEIISQVRHGLSHPTEIDSPISVAIDIKLLRQSENPADKMTAEIVTMLQNFQISIDDKLDRKLAQVEEMVILMNKRGKLLTYAHMANFADKYSNLVENIIDIKKRSDDETNEFPSLYTIEEGTYELGQIIRVFLDALDSPLKIRASVEAAMDKLEYIPF